MMMKTWIRLSGIAGLVLIGFGIIGCAFLAGDPLFRIAVSQIILGIVLSAFYVVSSFGETVSALLRNKEKLMGVVAGLLTLILIVGVNVISQSQFGEVRFDVTKNKIHTLDLETIKILKGLNTDVEVSSFVVDPRYRGLFETLADRYQYQSKHISYKTLDGKKDPRLMKQLGVTENQIVFRNPKTDKKVVLDAGQINEQEFTSGLRRLIGETGKKIYFITGSSGSGIDDRTEKGLYFTRYLLEREGYDVAGVNLAEKSELPKDAAMLVYWGNDNPAAPGVVSLLETFVDAGGKLVIAQDPVLNATKDAMVSNNLEPLLKKFGLEIGKSIIVQLRPALAVQQKAGKSEIVRTGTQRLVRIAGLGTSGHPIVLPLKDEIFDFVFTQPVLQLDSVKNEGLDRQIITETAEAAFLESSIKKLLGAEETVKEEIKGNGPFPLAQSAILKLSTPGPYGSEAKLIAFGNAEFARNTAIQQGANADLLMNSFNFLVDSKEGLTIRPKSWTPSTLRITEETKRAVYFASIFLLPMLIILFGLSVWNFRRSRV